MRVSSAMMANKGVLRLGFVPEHFSTPIHFAFTKYGLDKHATLHPYPEGTGRMVEDLRSNNLDIGIGLTDAWIVAVAKRKEALAQLQRNKISKADVPNPISIVGAYVTSPLRWAVLASPQRSDLNKLEDLKRGMTVGISRLGSGSQVMAGYTAYLMNKDANEDSRQFFTPKVCGAFGKLRDAIKDGSIDFFMWEHYTSKKFMEDGSLKKVGEVPTPWPSWSITCRSDKDVEAQAQEISKLLTQGVEYMRENAAETADYISTNMEYSRQDAEAWFKEVGYPVSIGHLDPALYEDAIKYLYVAGALGETTLQLEDLVKPTVTP